MNQLPPDVRESIEKTVSYVQKHGSLFVEKLINNDVDGRFSFLKEGDPLHILYLEALNGKITEKKLEPIHVEPFKFTTENTPISLFDLEVIKLTALHSARKPESFAEEVRNHMTTKGQGGQFAFLDPKHTLHGLYQAYVEQYRIVMDNVEKGYFPKRDFLALAHARAAAQTNTKVEAASKSLSANLRKLKMASINWQDFVIVHKATFGSIEEASELAPAITRESVMHRSLQQKASPPEVQETQEFAEAPKMAEAKEKATEEAAPKDPSHTENEAEAVDTSAAVPKGMKIRAAGATRKRKAEEPLVECPISGRKVPELKYDEHLHILLRDPKYQEEKQRYLDKHAISTNLTTTQVHENIKRLVSGKRQK